jgi:hypothetical protein
MRSRRRLDGGLPILMHLLQGNFALKNMSYKNSNRSAVQRGYSKCGLFR